jgi:coenzyme F420-0:L-glutamate ligase/coenzyme F420-1:gamma-L-glutamate ligase
MSTPGLSLYAVEKLPLIKAGDDLAAQIIAASDTQGLAPEDGDVIIVAQKIVSKAEGRQVKLSSVAASTQAEELARATDKDPRIVELILQESDEIVRSRPGVIIAAHKSGIVMANAGIDRSNVDADADQVLLLPKNSNQSATDIRARLQKHFGVQLGVVIADSVGRAWRMGTTGMALGSAGVEALQNLRGNRDMFGRELQVSEHALADSIASAAELLMGEGEEGTPVVLLRGLAEGKSEQDCSTLIRPKADDMFR